MQYQRKLLRRPGRLGLKPHTQGQTSNGSDAHARSPLVAEEFLDEVLHGDAEL